MGEVVDGTCLDFAITFAIPTSQPVSLQENQMTIAHLRFYTIKPGKMDSWVALILGEGEAVMAECGMKIESSWINRELNQFIWIRSYEDSIENIEKCENAFENHEWRKSAEITDFLRAHVDHREIVLIEST